MSIPVLQPVRGLDIVAVRTGLWRVSHANGALLGHIEISEGDDGARFAARRLLPGTARARELGQFCNAADAAECFR